MTVSTVSVIVPGPQGPPGPSAYEVWLSDGNVGTQDVFLASMGGRYVHTQATLSSSWTISHSLNRHPAIHVEDSVGNIVYGSIQHVSNDEAVVSFANAFTGTAVCT